MLWSDIRVRGYPHTCLSFDHLGLLSHSKRCKFHEQLTTVKIVMLSTSSITSTTALSRATHTQAGRAQSVVGKCDTEDGRSTAYVLAAHQITQEQ